MYVTVEDMESKVKVGTLGAGTCFLYKKLYYIRVANKVQEIKGQYHIRCNSAMDRKELNPVVAAVRLCTGECVAIHIDVLVVEMDTQTQAKPLVGER